MGRDKALLPSHGRTRWRSWLRPCGRTGRASLVGGSRRHAFPEFGFVPDLYPGEGPLGGILTALDDSKADWNLIVACDMPGLKVDFLRQLLDLAPSTAAADAIIPVGPSGRLEPLCAAYHRDARRASGGVRPRRPQDRDGARRSPHGDLACSEELSCFQNVNTPEEWAPYER
jgi:molybdenum cofactor guanylyltransferase